MNNISVLFSCGMEKHLEHAVLRGGDGLSEVEASLAGIALSAVVTRSASHIARTIIIMHRKQAPTRRHSFASRAPQPASCMLTLYR